MLIAETHPPTYHHFLLLLWEERDLSGAHLAWRMSLQDAHSGVRLGLQNLEELATFLKQWMESSSTKGDSHDTS
jgi:hypothetical protein